MLTLTDYLSLHVSGGAVLDVRGPGYFVFKTSDLTVDIGQATGNDNMGDDPDISFTDADIFSFSITNGAIWGGTGGKLDNSTTPMDWSDATVSYDADAKGFLGTVTGTVNVVTINQDSGDDYFGLLTSNNAIKADLLGDDKVELHIWDATLVINRADSDSPIRRSWTGPTCRSRRASRRLQWQSTTISTYMSETEAPF